MNYHKIKHCDMLNGFGLRSVIWLSGCSHNCKGCQNPQTHDPESGNTFDAAAIEELFRFQEEGWCSGITLSGGDPLFPLNRKEVLHLVSLFKERYPNKTIWLYTGYTYESIKEDKLVSQILSYIDVLVDGVFVESLKTVNLHYRGSSNQRVLSLSEGGCHELSV